MNIARTILPPGFTSWEQWEAATAIPQRKVNQSGGTSVFPSDWFSLSPHQRFNQVARHLMAEVNKLYSVTKHT